MIFIIFLIIQRMARVSINLRVFFEETLYSEVQAFIPRKEAEKIPQLKIEEREKKMELMDQEVKQQKNPKSNKSQSLKKESDPQEQNQMVDEVDDNLPEDIDVDDEDDIDMEIQPSENENIPYAQQDDDEDIDQDISDLSPSISNIGTFGKLKTKRQKRQLDNFIQLPNKKPRKGKKLDEASQLIRKEQKQRKRKQYLKKNMEAQQKATFDKILKETGRKFRQREQRQMKDEMEKNQKAYRNLGDIPKIITKYNNEGIQIATHSSSLFPPQMLTQPQIRMKQACNICELKEGKYKTKKNQRFCSVQCYKKLISS